MAQRRVIGEIEKALDKIEPDDLSPREALEILYRLKRIHAREG